MTKKILMFYDKSCLDSEMIMPLIKRINERPDKEFEIELHEVWKDEDSKKLHKKYSQLLKRECGRDSVIPSFLDIEGNRALCGPTPEKLMEWLFGPDWWK